MRDSRRRRRGDGLDRAVAASASASASASEAAQSFPIEAFADISEDPVSGKAAVECQTILDDAAHRAGIAATVMTADGTWSEATGKADGVRDVTVNDQFVIAGITKSLVVAQVMQMVGAGELGLDDPAAVHLPPDLDFDANEATIRRASEPSIPSFNRPDTTDPSRTAIRRATGTTRWSELV